MFDEVRAGTNIATDRFSYAVFATSYKVLLVSFS
jgi:hypothetical protein